MCMTGGVSAAGRRLGGDGSRVQILHALTFCATGTLVPRYTPSCYALSEIGRRSPRGRSLRIRAYRLRYPLTGIGAALSGTPAEFRFRSEFRCRPGQAFASLRECLLVPAW
jgi:hypothetical protein